MRRRMTANSKASLETATATGNSLAVAGSVNRPLGSLLFLFSFFLLLLILSTEFYFSLSSFLFLLLDKGASLAAAGAQLSVGRRRWRWQCALKETTEFRDEILLKKNWNILTVCAALCFGVCHFLLSSPVLLFSPVFSSVCVRGERSLECDFISFPLHLFVARRQNTDTHTQCCDLSLGLCVFVFACVFLCVGAWICVFVCFSLLFSFCHTLILDHLYLHHHHHLFIIFHPLTLTW